MIPRLHHNPNKHLLVKLDKCKCQLRAARSVLRMISDINQLSVQHSAHQHHVHCFCGPNVILQALIQGDTIHGSPQLNSLLHRNPNTISRLFYPSQMRCVDTLHAALHSD